MNEIILSIKKCWQEFWGDKKKKRDFGIGFLILFAYVFFNFLRGMLDNWILADNSPINYSVAKIISIISFWFGNLAWATLVFIIIYFYFKKKRPNISYGIFGGCLFILLIFLSGLAALFRIFF